MLYATEKNILATVYRDRRAYTSLCIIQDKHRNGRTMKFWQTVVRSP